jgi:protein O-GlcNAc transferase
LETDAVDSAIRSLESVLRCRPNDSQAVYYLGEAYVRQKQPNRALRCFQKSVAIDPYAVKAHFRAASLSMEAGKIVEAVNHLLSVVQNKPSDWQIWVNLCSYLRDCKELKHAKECGHRAIQLNPYAFQAWLNLANVYLDLKCYQTSLEYYERAYELNPSQGTVICNLLNISMMVCDWDRTKYYARILDRLTASALKRGDRPDETPFINISRNDNPEQNLAVAKAWSRSIKSNNSDVRNQVRIKYLKKHRKKIRIGYISNNFRNHPTGHITRQLYRSHDRNRFEVYCFSYGLDDNSHIRK